MIAPRTLLRSNPLLTLLVFVPSVFVAQALRPEWHTLLFVLSVLAIVPLAALLSRGTESVAAKTGDTVGGLLNATLGDLTELVADWLVRRADASATQLRHRIHADGSPVLAGRCRDDV
jgi:Ca2+:H+ antiporter